ncbi:MAG: sulfide/dihydroorotate dehydrogenase-like FAD/NAD-binding protein [Erysipelotrichaceae bacterium]|jgi:ferredoxin--NADP+ reductase|nr:sulfide/dihydroorotate dehydrogenase-like FAD/NAD-binding protein [Erysipelotrichaceae bacterium]
MFEILEKQRLNPTVVRLSIQADWIARHAKAGQFLILRPKADSERIPFTIFKADKKAGTVDFIYQIVGATTLILDSLKVGDTLCDAVGPLGKPTETTGYTKAIIVGGGVGCAIAYPVAKAMADQSVDITTITGFRSRDLVILQKEFSALGRHTLCSDDGSCGIHGLVTDVLAKQIEQKDTGDLLVFCVGPLAMMRAVSNLTKTHGIKTLCSMNPLMIDGTGMCGCCRLSVNGRMRFACVDGPDFDGHQVDFDEAIARLRLYGYKERQDYEHACKLLEVNHE